MSTPTKILGKTSLLDHFDVEKPIFVRVNPDLKQQKCDNPLLNTSFDRFAIENPNCVSVNPDFN